MRGKDEGIGFVIFAQDPGAARHRAGEFDEGGDTSDVDLALPEGIATEQGADHPYARPSRQRRPDRLDGVEQVADSLVLYDPADEQKREGAGSRLDRLTVLEEL